MDAAATQIKSMVYHGINTQELALLLYIAA